MKSSRIKIVALITILLISVTSFATKNGKLSIDERATLQMQKINKVCNLTTQQQVQVKQVFITKFTNQQAITRQKESSKSSGSVGVKNGNRANKEKVIIDNKNQTINAMKSILTADQVAKWQAYRQSMKK
jgi:hypothetical protein